MSGLRVTPPNAFVFPAIMRNRFRGPKTLRNPGHGAKGAVRDEDVNTQSLDAPKLCWASLFPSDAIAWSKLSSRLESDEAACFRRTYQTTCNSDRSFED